MSGILAIETATACGSVALWMDGAVAKEESFAAPRGHSTAIFEPLGRILEADDSKFESVVVGTGPGSYGGVRVGIAVANTLGVALGVSVAGVPSLVAPKNVDEADYTVVGDARRGEFFVARVRGRTLDGEIALVKGEDFRRAVEALLEGGEVVMSFDEALPEEVGDLAVTHTVPGAGVLAARYAEMSSAEEGAPREGEPIEPIYLRAPYITVPKQP